MKKMLELIETKLIDIRIQMQKLEETNTMAFISNEWKLLHAKRELLAELLNVEKS